MKKYLLLLTAAAMLAAPRAAHAYIATTGSDTVNNGDTDGSLSATIGDTFQVNAGSFTAYTPTDPGDPILAGGDIANYHYSLNGIVASAMGTSIDYTGSYVISYTGFAPTVSQGTFNIMAAFTGPDAVLTGTLTEQPGFTTPAPFADLGPVVSYTGTYQGNLRNPAIGTIQGALTRTSAVPEPGSMAFLATGLLPLAGLLRRRK